MSYDMWHLKYDIWYWHQTFSLSILYFNASAILSFFTQQQVIYNVHLQNPKLAQTLCFKNQIWDLVVHTLDLQSVSFSRLFLWESELSILRLSCIFLIFWTPKFDKQWENLRFVWIDIPTGGPSGNQTTIWGCAPHDSLITIRTSNIFFFLDPNLRFLLFIPDLVRWVFIEPSFLKNGLI